MSLLLSPRFWIAVAVAGILALSHLFVYRAGRAMLGNEIANERIATAQESIRKTEIYADKKDAALVSAAKRGAAAAADAGRARDALDGLRGELASQRANADESLTACTNRANTNGELLVASAAFLARLAEKCDRHASDAKTLVEAWPR